MKSVGVVLTILILGFAIRTVFAGRVTLLRTPEGGIQPQAAVDAQRMVHLIYHQGDPKAGDIFYVQGSEGRSGFSKPIRVNAQPGSAAAVGTIRGAQLAIGKTGRVHVAWNGKPPANGNFRDAPMLYTRLNDAGTGFEPERNVITSAGGLDGGGAVAADSQGNVYVLWHAPKPGTTDDEADRAVFITHSLDEGKTFAPEKSVLERRTGACACCSMKAFVDGKGNLFALYRGALEMVNRNELLLRSRDHGNTFEIIYEHQWRVSSCPMSSAFLSQSNDGVLAAAETHEGVFFIQINSTSGKVSSPISPETKAKHPVVISNQRGEVLLAWIEGTSWAKGGLVAWQVYGADGNPSSECGRADGVPVWSLATAYADSAGNFVIVY